MRSFCGRLAGEGYLALAPDLCHGDTASTIEEAERLRSRLKKAAVSALIAQASERLWSACGRGDHRIGVVGFSLGGYWGFHLAEESEVPIGATAVFYATRNGVYTRSRSAFQIHLAERDDYVAATGVKRLQKALGGANSESEFYTYPGTTHWFFEDDRPGAFNAEAAELAWTRLLSFLKRHVR
jgi:carboxymethylenebutenolidase